MSRENWKPGNMLYPLPVVMVGCQREGEKPNIVTVAWTGTVCSDPPCLSISLRQERYSYGIIKETGEFTVNLTTKELAWAADYCGVKSGRDIDKFKECRLTPLKSEKIKAPGIAESPVCLECKVKDVIPLGSHDMFLAEIVSVSADGKYMDKSGRFNLALADPIVYSHGTYYGMGEKIGTFGYSVKKK